MWTPPLRELTPDTSYGFELIDFARRIGEPFDPWQEWLAVHIGELLPDGRPRFRTILILVSRQNGKTRFAKVWALWNLFVDLAVPGRYDKPTILGISSKLEYSKETWSDACRTAAAVDELARELPRNARRVTNGECTLTTTHGTMYRIAASNEDAGRSLTIHRLFVDELRRQKDWTAWDAAEPTTSAVTDAQIMAASNQGDDSAVVLDSLRGAAITYLETGAGDPTLGLFEWSSSDGADPEDVAELLQSNPNAGYRLPVDALLHRAARAKAAGGKQLTGFKTEAMCMRVHELNPAIDAEAWDACLSPGTMDAVRDRIAVVLDVSPDQNHVIAVAAAELPDGRVRFETVKAWSGRAATRQAFRDLPGLFTSWKRKPRAFGWFPNGPAASLAADLADPLKRGRRAWPPRGVDVAELTAETNGLCMALAEVIKDGGVAHSDDELINLNMRSAQKLPQGKNGQWRFMRMGSIPVNGSYACAGGLYLAKNLPPAIGKPRLVGPRDDAGS